MARKRSVRSTRDNVTIWGPDSTSPLCSIPNDRVKDVNKLNEAATRWANVVRNRQRWSQYDEKTDTQRRHCFEQLDELIQGSSNWDEIANQSVLEVRIPFDHEPKGWGARIMPWEFLLQSAISHHLGYPDFSTTVVRYLQHKHSTPRSSSKLKKLQSETAAIITSTPSALAERYDFNTEFQLIESRLNFKPQIIDNPNSTTLREIVATDCPDILHFAGCDSRQVIRQLDLNEEPYDGIGLKFDQEKKTEFSKSFLSSMQLARIIGDESSKTPHLAVFNLYYSASRTAALAVAKGVSVALGFQDTIRDSEAEFFLSEFYRGWNMSGGNPLVSFLTGRKSLHSSGLSANGIVMWSRHSIVRDAAHAMPAAEAIVGDTNSRRVKEIQFERRLDVKQALEVQYDVKPGLNYSLLHNGQPLFDFFTLSKKNLWMEGEIGDVRVEIELLGGGEPLVCRTTTNVGDSGVDLTNQLFVPLTSKLTRSIDAAVESAIRVKVSVGQFDGIIESTERVRLLPVREWVDDDANRYYLPSFVFPGDPAVRKIINAATPHLRASLADPVAGFDGYQSLDGDDPDFDAVHWQVQSIWAAILNLSLIYVNPPPSHSTVSQRLRTPSEVVDSRLGTCIDLALLFASCLEYIDIYPAIFLLEGHAFVGYWRSEQDWAAFMYMKEDEMYGWDHKEWVEPANEAWIFNQCDFNLVYAVAHQGKLIPLEATGLTDNTGFDDARDEGWDNFYLPSEFNSLIDIKTARYISQPITPLPLGDDRE